MNHELSRSSTKKGPGRIHYEPADDRCRADKAEVKKYGCPIRKESGAKLIRGAFFKTLTRKCGHG